MLHTKAGNPTAPLHPEEKEKDHLLIASLAITNIVFPTSPSFNPNTCQTPLLANVLG